MDPEGETDGKECYNAQSRPNDAGRLRTIQCACHIKYSLIVNGQSRQPHSLAPDEKISPDTAASPACMPQCTLGMWRE